MIEPPPCSAMCRAASRVPAITPSRLTRMTLSNSAKSSSNRPFFSGLDRPGVVDHDVQAAERLDRGRRRARPTCAWSPTSVWWKCASAPTVGGQRLAELVLHVGDHDRGALGDEPLDDAAADARRAAGDDRDLACQFLLMT